MYHASKICYRKLDTSVMIESDAVIRDDEMDISSYQNYFIFFSGNKK